MYLELPEILATHAAILKKYGGIEGIRDAGLLHSIIHRPQQAFGGNEMFPGVFMKAAAYCEGVAQFHAFADGNKRTAFAVTHHFLTLNGVALDFTDREIVDFMLSVATKNIDTEAIATWLRKHAKKTR